MSDYKQKLNGLADKLKNQKPQTPIQQVQPVQAVKRPPPTEDDNVEVQFNNWIPRWLKKQVLRFSFEQEQSLKEINIEALKLFLKKHNKPQSEH